jgi:hypothetical protein
MASEFEFHAQCLYEQMDKVMKNTTHATSALDTRMARIETALTALNVSHMTERLDAQTQCMNKMRWGTFWSLCMIAVVQAVMFAALGYYMHEYIRGNAECIRGNAECLAYMKEPAECEPSTCPVCEMSDAICLKCMASVGLNFMADMLKE